MVAKARKRRRKDRAWRSPSERLRYLESKEGIAQEGDLRHEQIRELRIRKRRIDLSAPSSTWADAQWEHGQALPPGMVECCRCKRMTPPVCVGSSGHCDDCRLGAMSLGAMVHLPSSPSGIAIAAARVAGVRLRF